MTDSQSYADRARKAISPSNLAVKALSIVAQHSPPLDDWPQVGANPQRKRMFSLSPSLPFLSLNWGVISNMGSSKEKLKSSSPSPFRSTIRFTSRSRFHSLKCP